MIRSLKFDGTAQIDAFLVFFYCYVQVCIECRRKNAKDTAMEECHAGGGRSNSNRAQTNAMSKVLMLLRR